MPIVERWTPISGYENCYAISNLARVKSLNRKVKHSQGIGFLQLRYGKILKQCHNRIGGYPFVTLWKNGKPKT